MNKIEKRTALVIATNRLKRAKVHLNTLIETAPSLPLVTAAKEADSLLVQVQDQLNKLDSSLSVSSRQAVAVRGAAATIRA